MAHIPTPLCVDTCDNPMQCGEDYQRIENAALQMLEALEAIDGMNILNPTGRIGLLVSAAIAKAKGE